MTVSKFFEEWQKSLKVGETVWGPWKRKFAWTKTVVSDTPIWLKFYYARAGEYTPRYQGHHTFYETALDLFDILKRGN